MQPGVLEELASGDVLYEEVVDALAAETGVTVDHASRDTSFAAAEEALKVLAERWRDGGRLAVVADEYAAEARNLLHSLTTRAAELAVTRSSSRIGVGRLAVGFERQATYRIVSPEQVRAADELCRLTR